MKNISFLFALAFALLAGSRMNATTSLCASATANLVTNCGFETGNLSGWTESVSGAYGQYYGVDTGDANSGVYGAYMAGQSSVLNLSQVLATTAGKSYLITFYLAHPDSTFTPYVNTFALTFGGTQLYSETDNVFGFTKFSFVGVAGGSSTTLQFGTQDPLSFFSLDDVVVALAPTPEPATFWLAIPLLLVILWSGLAKNAVNLRAVFLHRGHSDAGNR